MIYALIVLLQVNHAPSPGCKTYDFAHKKWIAGGCPSYTTWEPVHPAHSFATKAECVKASASYKVPDSVKEYLLGCFEIRTPGRCSDGSAVWWARENDQCYAADKPKR